jgi:hypothetical protein
MATLGVLSSDDGERVHAHEGFHRSVLGFPSSLAVGDSHDGAVHYPLCHQTKIHPAQMESERRASSESRVRASGRGAFPAYPLLRFLLPARLTVWHRATIPSLTILQFHYRARGVIPHSCCNPALEARDILRR